MVYGCLDGVRGLCVCLSGMCVSGCVDTLGRHGCMQDCDGREQGRPCGVLRPVVRALQGVSSHAYACARVCVC